MMFELAQMLTWATVAMWSSVAIVVGFSLEFIHRDGKLLNDDSMLGNGLFALVVINVVVAGCALIGTLVIWVNLFNFLALSLSK